jgi:hypothetical protein
MAILRLPACTSNLYLNDPKYQFLISTFILLNQAIRLIQNK